MYCIELYTGISIVAYYRGGLSKPSIRAHMLDGICMYSVTMVTSYLHLSDQAGCRLETTTTDLGQWAGFILGIEGM